MPARSLLVHYGSTVFDEIDGAKLEVNICDDCLKAAQQRGIIGYWPGLPRRKLGVSYPLTTVLLCND
jgi:hypothetical protein